MAKSPIQAALNNSHDHGVDHHITPTLTYVIVLVLLSILMGLTLFFGERELPDLWFISGTIVNQTVAMIIAILKASLVVFIFMGVWHGTKLTKLWAATGFVWFFLLGLILIDYPMRAFESVDGWEGPKDKPNIGRDGSALPRSVTPSSQAQPVTPNETNVRPRQ